MRDYQVSQRRACVLIGVDPKTVRRERPPDHAVIREAMREIAGLRRRFGYRRVGVMLERKGHIMNHKKLYRLYREEGLSVRRRRGRKRARGSRTPMPVPLRPNDRWSMDFVADTFGASRRLRILAILADPHAYPFRYRGVAANTLFEMVAVIALPEALLHALGYRSFWLRVPLWLGWSIFPASLVLVGLQGSSYLAPSWLWCAVFCLAIVGWNCWREDREGLLLRLALFLPALERVDYWIGQLLRQPALFPRAFLAGGHRWHPNDIFSLLVSAVILTLLLRRVMADRQERQRLSGELESARIVQHHPGVVHGQRGRQGARLPARAW